MIESVWNWLLSDQGFSASLWTIGIALALGVVTEWAKMARDVLRRRVDRKLVEHQKREFEKAMEKVRGEPLVQVEPVNYFEPNTPVDRR